MGWLIGWLARSIDRKMRRDYTGRRFEEVIGRPVAEAEAVACSYSDAIEAGCGQVVDDVTCLSRHLPVRSWVFQRQLHLLYARTAVRARWHLYIIQSYYLLCVYSQYFYFLMKKSSYYTRTKDNLHLSNSSRKSGLRSVRHKAAVLWNDLSSTNWVIISI